MEKVKEYLNKNLKLFIFIIIFCVLVCLHNQNSQTLNYILKRGVILEYSLKNDTQINKKEIEKKLSSLYIKYSLVDVVDNDGFDIYDFEQEKVEKSLLVALPVLAREDKTILFNNISDYIFENYEGSKLINIRTLNNNYSDSYSGFLKFVSIFFITSIIWLILMYLIYDVKTINQKIKESLIGYFEKQKENFKNLIQNTKEKGCGYLLKKILFDDNKEGEETSITKEIISTIVFVIVAVILIRFFIGELRWIPSGSMRPTILEHDRVFVEKTDFPKKEIKRGDILVFYPPSTVLSNNPVAVFSRLSGIFCKDIAYIKRAIGLPGEKFEIKYDETTQEYRVLINDKPLNEPYISSKTQWSECREEEGMYCGPFIIPKGNYFMMGDNRNNSKDSRFWGFLDEKRIIGRANFMFWPISRINLLRDKYLELHLKKDKNNYGINTYILNRYEFL